MPNISIESLEALLNELKKEKAQKSRPHREPVCAVMDPNFPVSLRDRLRNAFGGHYCRDMRRLIDEGLERLGY